jgi:hypothetical protein
MLHGNLVLVNRIDGLVTPAGIGAAGSSQRGTVSY